MYGFWGVHLIDPVLLARNSHVDGMVREMLIIKLNLFEKSSTLLHAVRVVTGGREGDEHLQQIKLPLQKIMKA